VNPVIINRLDRVRTGHGSYYLRKVMGFKCGSWKSNMLSENKKGKKTKNRKKQQMSLKQALISVQIDTSTHFVHYNTGKYVK